MPTLGPDWCTQSPAVGSFHCCPLLGAQHEPRSKTLTPSEGVTEEYRNVLVQIGLLQKEKN